MSIHTATARLHVQADTTLADLRAFAGAAGGSDKIRGHRNADGSITLYARNAKASNLLGGWKTMTEVRARQNALATDAIRQVLARHVRGAPEIVAHRDQSARLEAAVDKWVAYGAKYSAAGLSDLLDNLLPGADQVRLAQDVIDQFEAIAVPGGAPPLDPQPALDPKEYGALDASGARFTLNGEAYTRTGKPIIRSSNDFEIVFFQDAKGTEVALKTVNPNANVRPDARSRVNAMLAAEGALLREAQAGDEGPGRPIRMLGTVKDPNGNLGIVMESAPFGSANDLARKIDRLGDLPPIINPGTTDLQKLQALHSDHDQKSAQTWRIDMARSLIAGVRHLHGRGILHLDIKLSNFLMDSGGYPRISDFGLSHRGIYLGENFNDAVGYLAPETCAQVQANNESRQVCNEVIKGALQHVAPLNLLVPRSDDVRIGRNFVALGRPADLWALGVALLELFTGVNPFCARSGEFDSDAERRLSELKTRDDVWRCIDEGMAAENAGFKGDPEVRAELRKLLGDLLNPNPAERRRVFDNLQGIFAEPPSLDKDALRYFTQTISNL